MVKGTLYGIVNYGDYDLLRGLLSHSKKGLECGDIFFKDSKCLLWYPSLCTGIPLTKKPDIYHRTTYITHDLMHTVLFDPLPDEDVRTYILGKMVGEVTSQFYSGGYITNFLQERHPEYDFSKRYYLKMWRLLKRKGYSDFAIIKSICYYAIYGDREALILLCGEDKELKKWCYVYMNLYTKMFEADLWWNREIYKQFKNHPNISNKLRGEMNILENKTLEGIIEKNIRLVDKIKNGGDILGKQKGLREYILGLTGKEEVYEHVKVSYSNKINDKVLEDIRGELR